MKLLKNNKILLHMYHKLIAPHHILLEEISLNKIEQFQNKNLKRLKKKNIITVAFFISTASKWKYDDVYKMMLLDKKFKPIIIVVPMHVWGREFMIKEMKKTYSLFKDRNYNVLQTYNKQKNKFLNVKKQIKPDIIFYSEPYNFVGKKYYITNFYKTSLCCHSQYAFMSDDNYQALYNKPFHNMLWAFFAETVLHKKYSEQYALNKGANVVVTGYPNCDVFLDKSYKPKNVWKKAGTFQKKIIWAPHHSINDDGGWANFLNNYEYMLKIAQIYKETVFFTFKPHPNLKPRLYKHKDWGKEKTDAYYKKWADMSNTQIQTNDYIDLFLTSDALIHDCGSFILEYIFTKKPALFLYKNEDIINHWNECGTTALNSLYKSLSYEDIIEFINNIVLEGNDYKKPERLTFLEKTLMPPNNQTASYNIFQYIKRELENK